MATMEPSPHIPSFKVISQVPQLVQTPAGQFQQGYRVTAMFSGTGTTFYVDVPMAQYSTANVKAMLSAHAAQVAEVDGYST